MTDTAAPPKLKRKGNDKAGLGRPPGRKNNQTPALEKAARQAAASIDGAFEGDAHAFLTAVYRDPAGVPLEIWAWPRGGRSGSRNQHCRPCMPRWTLTSTLRRGWRRRESESRGQMGGGLRRKLEPYESHLRCSSMLSLTGKSEPKPEFACAAAC